MKQVAKKHISAVMALFMMLWMSLPVSAVSDADVIVSLKVNHPVMQVNGVESEIDDGRGTKPVIRDGRTLVPIRAIVEAFGGTVGWEASTRSVLLGIEDNVIQMTVDSHLAYVNGEMKALDVAPTVIDERSMMPIRFVAESFNLGVAWDGDTGTITVIRNGFGEEEYQQLMQEVPAYSGKASVQLNENVPYFEAYEIIGGSFEYYSSLDELGRCDVCFASVAEDIMPTEPRGNISSVTPTGWVNKFYDTVPGGYLYNRCHLIGYQLTGENANARNLITGTRYLNMDGMLPFENAVADYIEKTGNRVMYRVTPVFTANNLVADGVLMEAYSVEDDGAGVSFCVYCYNVQPYVTIDYADGSSYVTGAEQSNEANVSSDSDVYRTPTGKRYHFSAGCGGKNSFKIALNEAIRADLTPCSKCVNE